MAAFILTLYFIRSTFSSVLIFLDEAKDMDDVKVEKSVEMTSFGDESKKISSTRYNLKAVKLTNAVGHSDY
jgi:hypothetical protein